MNFSFNKCAASARSKAGCDGFALVVTLSLMVLLAVVAIGLLSLSSIALRATGEGAVRAQAEANARLALMLAIGDLQKQLGPDQRISASASLTDHAAPLGVTGAWDSWHAKELGKTYDKVDKFRGWLRSDILPGMAQAADKPPHVTPGSPGSVLLLDHGTLKDRSSLKSDDMRIALRKTPVVHGRNQGNLAWVVIDESTKSRFDLHREHGLPASVARIATAGAPAADGVFALDQLAGFRPDAATSGKMISHGTASLAGGTASLPAYAPDLSNWSLSLLTDPVAGGLKKDLSTLFARKLTASEARQTLYAGAGLATGNTDPPMSLLAGYHDLYMRLGVAAGSTNPGSDGVVASVPIGYAASTTPRTPTEPLLMPSLLRVDMIFSLIAHNVHGKGVAATELKERGFPYRLWLQYLPVVTIHNPYDVPMVFDSLKVNLKDVPIAFQFSIDGEPLTTRSMPLNWLYQSTQGREHASKSFGIGLEPITGTSIRLEPGQTKLFGTPRMPPSWSWQNELDSGFSLLGDWGNNKTQNCKMIPKLVTQSTTSGSGFCTDHTIPGAYRTAKGFEHTWKASGSNVALRPDSKIGVWFEPYVLSGWSSASTFAVSMELTSGGKTIQAGSIEMNFGNVERLKEVLLEGSSVRFPQPRTFPAFFPDPLVDGVIDATDIYEPPRRPVKDYVRPKPFAIFSLSSRTTKESFFRSRPYADGSPAVNAGKFDFSRGKDQPADLPFEMVMMPIHSNTSAIEEVRANEEGFFFGGHGSLYGTPRATFYEFPRVPLQSLAGFRHANLASSGAPPFTTYTVGESRAHPMIPTTDTQAKHTAGNSLMLDHAWLSNTALWNSHFLSTLADYSGGAFASPGKPAATVRSEFFKDGKAAINPRLVPLATGDAAESALQRAAATDGWLGIAADLAVEGGFNVNSTSVDAWVSVLSSLRDESLSTATGAADTGEFAAIPRVRHPSEAGIDGNEILTRQRRWQGFRQLDQTAVHELATRIVAEVRARGPFLSLSEFVNRRIGPASDERSLKGAVEAAIDKAGINELADVDGIKLDAGNLGNHNYAVPEAAHGFNTTAAPGHLTQGDVLTLLGSRLTVRGDTFVIRSYGEAPDGGGGVLARAWCEAVVQRLPDYVDPTDAPTTPAAELNDTNRNFGRSFIILSFRWLAPEEV